jgi:hypothetical protein
VFAACWIVVAVGNSVLSTTAIDQRDTHRLIPAQLADEGASVLTRLTEDDELLNGIFELDNATNDRLLGESGMLPGVDQRELVFGIPSYRIINAAFCHTTEDGTRFSTPGRGVWYAGFERDTSIAEIIYHKQLWLQETRWDEEEVADYVDYLADFRADFHDLRRCEEHRDCLDPSTNYSKSQALAMQLLEIGSSGIVYPSLRKPEGTCIACFRPVLVLSVRRDNSLRIVFPNAVDTPEIVEL